MRIASTVIGILVTLAIPILVVRFYKRPVAAFHRVFTNRFAVLFAARFPGFALVTNVGRSSGTLYRTPVNVFRVPDGFLIALTYGRDSGWVSNVLAAGKCQLETRSVRYELFRPLVTHDRTRRRFPFVVRIILGLIDANDFLQLSISDANTVARNGDKVS
jgi:deazaflavin-dependent oxidoreductase (nitroreductase family)